MNKVYLLMLCLLSTSFVGCLDTDEDETLEPLGTDENSDSSYESLKDEIKNLTEEIEKLRDDIKSLEVYEYNPPLNSSLTFNTYDYDSGVFRAQYEVEKYGNDLIVRFVGESPQIIDNEGNSHNYENWTNQSNCNESNSNNSSGNNSNDDCDNDGIKNTIDNCPYTANNNQRDADGDGIGDACDLYPETDQKNHGPCTYSSDDIIIYNSNMDIIRKGAPAYVAESYERNCILKEQYQSNSYYYYEQFGQMWSVAFFTLEEEPVRIEIMGQTLTF